MTPTNERRPVGKYLQLQVIEITSLTLTHISQNDLKLLTYTESRAAFLAHVCPAAAKAARPRCAGCGKEFRQKRNMLALTCFEYIQDYSYLLSITRGHVCTHDFDGYDVNNNGIAWYSLC